MNDKNNKALSDFNDLQNSMGVEEVRRQLEGAQIPSLTAAANDSDMDKKPPGPSDNRGRPQIGTLLKRYSFVIPDGKVWDLSKQRTIKDAAFKKMCGEKLYREWLDHDDRMTHEMDEVAELEAAAQKEGGGGLGNALARYVYLYPTDTVWDREQCKVVSMTSLKYAIADCYSFWVAHPHREQLDMERLVFDPACKADPKTHINMYTGIKMESRDDPNLAVPVFMLANHLCNGDAEAYQFLLDWIAYPLQFPGSKMASAILMHSETHGSGKSLFFEECVKPIYGEYAATLGQHQLESQYTDWRSRLLFALFEEIFSRDQKYSHTGTIKHMITGKTHRIEKKFVSGWEEANFMNGVFLSNEIQPFPLEPSDRRFLVVWPKSKLTDELNKSVMYSINNGGVEAFYHELMTRDLSHMTTHTEPPITPAKEFLIDFGRATWDIFYREWESEHLDIPFTSCLHGDLFKAYRIWCNKRHEHCMGQNKFSGLIASRLRRRRDVRYQVGVSEKKGTVFVVGTLPEGKKQVVWLGESIHSFQEALKAADPQEMP